MLYASHTSLPSGAVRLVRLSALTRSRILRTASLEFDIGFLLDVLFFIGNGWARSPALPAHLFPTGASAIPIPALRCSGLPDNSPVMAFGMPETELSRHLTGGKR